MTYFPENTTTCFTTHLAREIRLTGECQVGIAEIHIPWTMMHIQESESSYTLKLGLDKPKPLENNGICYFPYGVYDNVAELAEEINKVFFVGDHQHLVPTEFQKGNYVLKRPADAPNHITQRSMKKYVVSLVLRIPFTDKHSHLSHPKQRELKTWVPDLHVWREQFPINCTSTQILWALYRRQYSNSTATHSFLREFTI